MKKLVSFILLFLITGSAFADSFDELFKVKYTEEERTLIENIEKCSLPLENDLVGFHWGGKFQAYFERKKYNNTEKFKEFLLEDKDQTWTYGTGYYFSGDPVSSSNYGKTLSIVRVKKGEPILDLSNIETLNCIKALVPAWDRKFNGDTDIVRRYIPNVLVKFPATRGELKADWYVIKLRNKDSFKIEKPTKKILEHLKKVYDFSGIEEFRDFMQ